MEGEQGVKPISEAERWRKLAEELAESLEEMVFEMGWRTDDASAAVVRAEEMLHRYLEAMTEGK